ncbi:Hsp20/alpha crystallin family protein [Ectothiorhodospira mobilis]|uniref:Hsp20/alpha crystallin family protein n=1 Tax=Ectothiorhodospira mobilis TaxID=195064 RepID=UPI0019057614|nr:Hsp20/alpha crystallin family protein [Ectothiorhodospira mobilis]MBK1692252.1 heat-shock protein Hsp20 [Ectothiorhodospira mobilis]
MANMRQLREGIGHAWDSVLEGWQRLYQRASGAITRFRPGAKAGDTHGGDGSDTALPARSSGWGVMAAEVFEGDDQVVVRLEAPGLDRDQFGIEVRGDHLVVSGEKGYQRERTEGRYRIAECAYGRFERAIPLPDAVDADRARARYRNGVLEVELPRSGATGRRRIQVQTD